MIEIGADTVITNNGSKTQYGGGIRNYGEITVSLVHSCITTMH
ncbi:MAG: hypothetical protein ACLRVN_05925 [Butyricicoccus sp.]